MLIKKSLIFLSLCALFIGINAQNSECNIQNNSFQVGEEVNYIVSYNWGFIWIDAGAVLFKTKAAKVNNKEVFHIIGAGKTFPHWDWVFKIRDLYQTWVDPVDLKPVKFDRDVEDGGYYIKVVYDFDREKNLAYSAHERTRKPFRRDTIKITDCTYDVLSIIYYARNIDYEQYAINDTIPVTVLMDNELYNIYFRYKGKEEKKIKNFGTFDCIRFGVFLVEGTIFNEGEDMDVWVTDDMNKIPVMIESPILVGSIKARVVGIKGNRHKINALNKNRGFWGF